MWKLSHLKNLATRLLLCAFAISCLASDAQTAESPITAIVVSSRGDVIVGSQSGIQKIDWPNENRRESLQTEIENVERLTFNSDESILYAAGGTPGEFGLIEAWSWPACELIERKFVHDDIVTDLVIPDRDKLLISCSIDGLICFGESDDQYLEGHSKAVLALCLVDSAQLLISAGRDRSLRVWDLNSRELKRTLNNHTADVRLLRVKPTDPERPNALPVIASAAEDHTIRLWQPSIGRLMRFARLESNALDLVWSPSGELIYAVCEDGCLRVVDPASVTVMSTIKLSDDWAYAIVNAPAGDGVIVGMRDGSLIHISDAQLQAEQEEHQGDG